MLERELKRELKLEPNDSIKECLIGRLNNTAFKRAYWWEVKRNNRKG